MLFFKLEFDYKLLIRYSLNQCCNYTVFLFYKNKLRMIFF